MKENKNKKENHFDLNFFMLRHFFPWCMNKSMLLLLFLCWITKAILNIFHLKKVDGCIRLFYRVFLFPKKVFTKRTARGKKKFLSKSSTISATNKSIENVNWYQMFLTLFASPFHQFWVFRNALYLFVCLHQCFRCLTELTVDLDSCQHLCTCSVLVNETQCSVL